MENLEEGSSTGDFESWMKGLWGGASLSLKRLRGGGLGGGLRYWGTQKREICKMPCRRASLSIGALLGKL